MLELPHRTRILEQEFWKGNGMSIDNTYSTVQAAKRLELPYGRIRGLLDNGLIETPEVRKGQKRRLTENDVWKIGLAAGMRQAGLSIKVIREKIMDLIGLQLAKNLPVFYIHDDPRYRFAAYWNKTNWKVTTSMIEIIYSFEKARTKVNTLIITNNIKGDNSKLNLNEVTYVPISTERCTQIKKRTA